LVNVHLSPRREGVEPSDAEGHVTKIADRYHP
jgi:hypothetical protein